MIAAVLGTIGCKKDFLNQTPQNTVSSGDFKNASDAEAAIVGAYSLMANSTYWYYSWNYLIDGDVRADNCYSGGSAPDIDGVDNFTSVATDNQPISEDWYELYMDIGACNSVLDNVPSITDPLLTGTRKAQILGEAKFLRAYHYSHLVRNYGGVVLQLHTIVNDQHTLKARSPVDSVYFQIVSDLKDAEASLPVSYTDPASSHSRATQGAAQALLAKVYAQMDDYRSCLDYCNKVLPPLYGGTGTAGYQLLSNFDWLFDSQHKNSAESIFELQHTAGTITHGYAQGLMLPPSPLTQYWTKFAPPTQDLVKAFREAGDSIRYSSSIFWQYNGPGSANPVPSPAHYAATDTIPYIWKIGRNFTGGWSGGSGDNLVLLRLADLVLLKAEALNALGQTAAAIPLVNAIRARVKLAPITVTSQTDVALAILKERRLELAFEGERWYDLLRFGAAYTINLMNSQVDGKGVSLGYQVTANRLLYPIPQADRDNNPNLSQNPEY
ncbi:MAG: RagB/SusD family nutrient uptake outer membrane protein [Bacteroidetes bacterium]|nr:RagB/SusD family nutrient uptake outer membrane protein [Bacteroidota bacterium]